MLMVIQVTTMSMSSYEKCHITHHASLKSDVRAIIFVMSVTGCRVSSNSWCTGVCGTSQVVPRELLHHFKLIHYRLYLKWVALASADCRPLNIRNLINKKRVNMLLVHHSPNFSEHQKMVLLSQKLQEIAYTQTLWTQVIISSCSASTTTLVLATSGCGRQYTWPVICSWKSWYWFGDRDMASKLILLWNIQSTVTVSQLYAQLLPENLGSITLAFWQIAEPMRWAASFYKVVSTVCPICWSCEQFLWKKDQKTMVTMV